MVNNKILFLILSMPKTIYFNLRTFGWGGVLCPVLISYRTKIIETHRGTIELNQKKKPFQMVFGYGGSKGVISNLCSEICLAKGSVLVLNGKTHFSEGCSIRNSGRIELGDSFSMNKNSFLSCSCEIRIGDNFMGGWNVNIRDSDGHYIVKNGIKKHVFSPVYIGNKVWVCSYADILKGVKIGNSCVIAYRSLVTKSSDEDNIMLGGCPARIIQKNIDWEV